ncbi:MAG: dinitrogenase iron-molybdenum cofactor biosynthesis protein [Candidatus Aegiribacteria sp.]|nr:dinitrogenase iron-molybdenum cofactor biosynthesis protein [Candidatus Aegiribacteria sp.]MBD3294855.1 dinitrogenase iron-molybdenum cofactor biosynthesis protein [Candidatus Fermentibacteria bacterium]
MRLAVSSDSQKGMDSSVSHHFGRCPYFTVVDVEGSEVIKVESIANPFFNAHSPGQVPNFIMQLEADVMLAGGMGRRAIEIFRKFGIQCSTGSFGTVGKAVESFLAGNSSEASPCRESIHHSHGKSDYESEPVDRLREEAAALLKKLDDVIVELPGDTEQQQEG